MELKSTLLNIVQSNVTKMHRELFNSVVTAARVIFAAKWKAVECPDEGMEVQAE